MKKLFIISTLLIFSISTPVYPARIDTSGVQEAQAVKGGRYFKRTLSDIDISGKKKSLIGKNRIAVPFFRLNFITDGGYKNRVGGITTSTAKVNSELYGVDASVFQRVTDETYQDLLNVLRQAGYEVLSEEELMASERYSEMDRDYPDEGRKSSSFTPSGKPFPGIFSDRSNALAKEWDAISLKVDLNVNFVIINRNQKKFSILRDKSAVEISQGINTLGQINAYSGKDIVNITLQQPVISQRPFGMVRNDTSAMNKVSDGIVAVGSILGGSGLGGKRQKTTSVTVDANPEQYRIAAGDTIVKINRNLAATLSELTTPSE